MWPRKLESFKECVTTHQSNASALKMDGAKASYLYTPHDENVNHRGVGMRVGPFEGYRVNGTGGANSVDLGWSSEYSSETLEG